MKTVYIYDAVRTPRGRGKADGKLHTVRPVHLAKTVLESIQQRNNLDTSLVNDVILGCVTQVGEQGGCIAKSAALYAGYADTTSGFTLNRFCGSGLEAINQGASSIMSGYFDMIVAGGVEAMSRIPIGSDGGAWMIDPDVATKTHFVPQGISADLIATLGGYSRTDVDSFAVESQKKATLAWEEKRFQKSIIPVIDQNGMTILDRDEHIRPGTTVESLSGLKPSFLEMGTKYGFDSVAIQKYPSVTEINHIHHAGNSSGIVDGASVVLLGNEETGNKAGLKPRAKIRSFSMVSTEPTIMLTGPGPATEKALRAAGMNIGDIDLIEINEAFASVVLRFVDEVGADMSKVNVNGGAIAMGHPLGATGAMLLGTVLDELERQNKSTGLVTLCIGGGMGIATIIERV
ncbi:MAG: acetyl-CoA C-acetyltransferase [Deltaproteobacteria bacterium]|nr:MAG: acetyl-CoA C-acetyltransferase [Deltaproteobacteria bacterium]